MEIKDFQKKIVEYAAKWAKKRNVAPSEQGIFNHLIEEVGELAHQYVNLEQRKQFYDEKEVRDALADTAIQLVTLAHVRGWDIEELILESIKDGEERLKE